MGRLILTIFAHPESGTVWHLLWNLFYNMCSPKPWTFGNIPEEVFYLAHHVLWECDSVSHYDININDLVAYLSFRSFNYDIVWYHSWSMVSFLDLWHCLIFHLFVKHAGIRMRIVALLDSLGVSTFFSPLEQYETCGSI